MQVVPESSRQIDDQDYGQAVVHLTWAETEGSHDLILAMVEMIPAELPHTSSPAVMDKVELSPQTLIHSRQTLSAAKGVEWYEHVRSGMPILLEDGTTITTTDLQEEPAWPAFLTSNTLPFSPSHWGSVRAHLMLARRPTSSVEALQTNAQAITWLAERWFFNILEYPEFLGAAALILPNPFLRGFEQTLGILPDGRTTSDFRFIPRAGKSVESLTLNIVEHRPFGRCDFRTIPLTSPYLRVLHDQDVQQTALELISAEHGLLDWHDPAGYLRSINFNMALQVGEKSIEVPEVGNRRPKETYTQSVFGLETNIQTGEQDPGDTDLMRKLYAQQSLRSKRADARRLGQQWFHGNQDEATAFVRSLIQNARKHVWIVDPYFASVELFRFALATSRSDVETLILTSAECLNKTDGIDASRLAGDVLLDQVEHLSDTLANSFSVKVMTGDKPEVHDRFLVIDDVVWLSGNSLNNIGERAGMMIKVPDPNAVIERLDIIRESARTIDLVEWKRRKDEGRKP